MHHSQEHTPPQSASASEQPANEPVSESPSPQSDLDQLAMPPRIMDLTHHTPLQIATIDKNVTDVTAAIKDFERAFEDVCRKPLEALVESASDEVLSSKQCMEIFECRRGLRSAVEKLEVDLHSWTRQDNAPLFRQYLTEIKNYTTPLYHHEKGVFRMIELSLEPGWRPHLTAALLKMDEAKDFTKVLLDWLAQLAHEVQEEIAKRASTT